MTVLKIKYKTLVMEHCLSKVEALNGGRAPPFSFFHFFFFFFFFFSCMRLCACARLVTLFMSSFLRLLTYYLSLLCLLFILFWYWFYSWHEWLQEQPSKGVLRKRCSENIQQIYRITPMSKFGFNKVALQLYWNSLQNGCSPVNILHNFRTPLSKNTSRGLLLRLPP